MRRKIVYIMGSAIIGIVTLLAVLLVLIATGVIDAGQRKLVFRSEDQEIVYNGKPLVGKEYELLKGKLKEGHTAQVTFSGIQTDVGNSVNSFSVTILDERGADVSHNYEIECSFGELSVVPRALLITTGSATKVYDGTELTVDSWICSKPENVVSGHTLSVKNTGVQLNVGSCKNTALIQITDSEGRDVTFNYSITSQLGDLQVTPRPIQIRSGSASKYYADDGIPLTCDEWEIVSITKLLDEHNITVAISGQQYEIGKSENTVAEVLITDKKTGKNQNYNYDITYKLGDLVVKDPEEEEDPNAEKIRAAFANGGLLKDNGLATSDAVVAVVRSEKDGVLYLKANSYGDYAGNSWTRGNSYPAVLDEKYSYNYLSGIALKNSGVASSGSVQIKSPYQYILPQYMQMGNYNYDIQSSDVSYFSTKTEYDLNCFFYNEYGKDLSGYIGDYGGEEALYRDFVEQNYLYVDNETRAYLETLIDQQGFSKDDKEIVAKIAEYIQNCAGYNISYDKALDDEGNVVLAFLRDYKQGVCRHYASAATLLYRSLGIPARYTVGVLAKGLEAGEWTEIPASLLHAWVEVYLDGVGWISVEVTGGPIRYFEKQYVVRPIDTFAEYQDEDTVLDAQQVVRGLYDLTKDGEYTVEVEISGTQKGLGSTVSEITRLIVYDIFGNDVTEDFNMTFEQGIVQIYKGQLTIETDNVSKTYDGTALKAPDAVRILSGSLLPGDKITKLECSSEITNVGHALNMFDLVIENANGEDVTAHYRVNRLCGALEVTKREICVVTGSVTKEYDEKKPKPVVSESWELKDGDTLVDGDVLTVSCVGTQTDIGESPNYVDKKKTRIFNQNGEDVTRNYKIDYEFGILKVISKAVEVEEES